MFYFKDCVMEGGVDFYCPRGWALAEVVHSSAPQQKLLYGTMEVYESSKSVFLNCRFIGDAGYKLGRYHRDAQFYLLTCSFDKNMAQIRIFMLVANPPTKYNGASGCIISIVKKMMVIMCVVKK